MEGQSVQQQRHRSHPASNSNRNRRMTILTFTGKHRRSVPLDNANDDSAHTDTKPNEPAADSCIQIHLRCRMHAVQGWCVSTAAACTDLLYALLALRTVLALEASG